MSRPRNRRGTSLAGTMVFLVLVMLLWVAVYRQAEAHLRLEKACTMRQVLATGGTRTLAWGMALLETGLPPDDPYSCRAVIDGHGTYVLTFHAVGDDGYTVSARPASSGDSSLPLAPATFGG